MRDHSHTKNVLKLKKTCKNYVKMRFLVEIVRDALARWRCYLRQKKMARLYRAHARSRHSVGSVDKKQINNMLQNNNNDD